MHVHGRFGCGNSGRKIVIIFDQDSIWAQLLRDLADFMADFKRTLCLI